MWLHRSMPAISSLASHSYYRLEVAGASVPGEGPVLIVANHNNSLMDAALVVVASERRVRFMAKAPLFVHPWIGWLVKAVGSVPVYRRMDDPKLVAQNFDSFRDVYAALADGAAVGIFPEGTSHSASRLKPLKTGAARIALGAAVQVGHSFPIVPVGLVFRDRGSFRSTACVIVGASCEWEDLAARGAEDKEAVRELTRRINRGMLAVTVNLRDWTDLQLVRCAEQVWTAELGTPSDVVQEVRRTTLAAEALAQLQLGEDGDWLRVARELLTHDRLLRRMGLTPGTLRSRVSNEIAAWWVLQRLLLVPLIPVAGLGLSLFWIPRELTGRWARKMARAEGEDAVPTFRVLIGFVVFLAWFLLIAAASSFVLGPWGAMAVFLSLPVIAAGALLVGERHWLSWVAMRRFFLLRMQRERIARLRARQKVLAERLRELLARATD